jgi:hypothetical protein
MKTVLLACVMLALGACASQPGHQAAAKDLTDKNCLRDTGSRIKHKEGDERCVHGRVITSEDLEQSGPGTIGEILQRLPR